MENWNMPQPLWGVGLLFYLCYVFPAWTAVISDLVQIRVYGFRGLRRCEWRGGPEGNLWMSGDRKYPKLFRLSELFICRVTKIILNYLSYLNFLNARWPNYLKSILSYICIQTQMGQRYQISKDEKSKAVSWLKVRKDWKEGILRWVEYLTKTVWIASSRQRLLPHQGWFQRCLVEVDSISKKLFGLVVDEMKKWRGKWWWIAMKITFTL